MLGTYVYKSHSASVQALNEEILREVGSISLLLNKYDGPLERGVEISESDRGFMLLWTEQLRRFAEVAPDNYRHLLTDILAGLDDEQLAPGQKLRSIDISLRMLRMNA